MNAIVGNLIGMDSHNSFLLSRSFYVGTYFLGGLIFTFGGGENMPLETKVYTLVALLACSCIGTCIFLFLTYFE